MAADYVLLTELNQSKQDCKIMVRIERLWNIIHLETKSITGMDLIVMDEKGAQMHASILGRDISKFQNQLEEKKVITLENFIIQQKNTSWCPLDNPLKIKFKPNTKVHTGNNSIQFPNPTFKFIEFNELPQRVDKTDPLTDVIGIFKSVDNEHTIAPTKNGDTPKKDLYIFNEARQQLRITFWGKAIEQLPATLKTSNDNKLIIIVTSTVVKRFGGHICLQTSFASKVYVDMDIPETFALKNSSIQSMAKRTIRHLGLTQICEIPDKIAEATMPFTIFCQATITSVNHDKGFYYDACPTCTIAVSKRTGSYWCYTCKQIIDEPDMRLRLQFEISDETGTQAITTFEEESKTLLDGKDLDDMLNLSLEINGKVLVNEALHKIIGKTFKFSIRISKYNLQNPDSPATAKRLLQPEQTQEEHKKARIAYQQD